LKLKIHYKYIKPFKWMMMMMMMARSFVCVCVCDLTADIYL